MRCSADRGYVTGTEPRSTGSVDTTVVSTVYGMGTMGGEVDTMAAEEAAEVAVLSGGALFCVGADVGMLSGWMGMWRRAATGPFCWSRLGVRPRVGGKVDMSERGLRQQQPASESVERRFDDASTGLCHASCCPPSMVVSDVRSEDGLAR